MNWKYTRLLIIIILIYLIIIPCMAQAKIVSVSTSINVLALDSDGSVYIWGYNRYGQLCNGIVGEYDTVPHKVPICNVTAIATCCGTCLALKDDGTVWAWGDGRDGILGYGGTEPKSTPIKVSNLTNITAISLCGVAGYALRDDGTVWAWGLNNRGYLGDDTFVDSMTPVCVKGLSDVAAIGEHGYYAIKKDGTLWVWGTTRNILGKEQCGISIDRYITAPIQIADISDVLRVTGDDSQIIFLKRDGSVWDWDTIGADMLTGTIDSKQPRTVTYPPVRSITDHVSDISADGSHYLVLKEDGTVWYWGDYIDNRVMDLDDYGYIQPVKVAGLDHVVDISASNYCIVLKDDGSIWGWGENHLGELGSHGESTGNPFHPDHKVVKSPELIWEGPEEAVPSVTPAPVTSSIPSSSAENQVEPTLLSAPSPTGAMSIVSPIGTVACTPGTTNTTTYCSVLLKIAGGLGLLVLLGGLVYLIKHK